MKKGSNIHYALPKLFGIGKSSAIKICNELGYSPNMKIEDLKEIQKTILLNKLKKEYRVEAKLREEIRGNVQRYVKNGSIHGMRHFNKLPVRGQRTHSNAKTIRKQHLGLPAKKALSTKHSFTKNIKAKVDKKIKKIKKKNKKR